MIGQCCRHLYPNHHVLYVSRGRNTLNVTKGDVVELVSGHVKDWFLVRTKGGVEGFIPAAVAGHGFL